MRAGPYTTEGVRTPTKAPKQLSGLIATAATPRGSHPRDEDGRCVRVLDVLANGLAQLQTVTGGWSRRRRDIRDRQDARLREW